MKTIIIEIEERYLDAVIRPLKYTPVFCGEAREAIKKAKQKAKRESRCHKCKK